FRFTEAPLHATTLAREGVEQGFDTVVAVGGDGTVNEVVNGLISPGAKSAEAVLGVIITGRGSDLARTIGIPSDYTEACSRLAGERTMTVDLGLVTFHDQGEQRQRYFVNVGGGGFDGEVAHRANRAPNFMGGTIPYLTSLVTTLLSYRNKSVELILDDQEPIRKVVNSVIVANCQFFGGGMRVAPDADPNDGLFDVIVIGDIDKVEFLMTVPKVYDGTHITHPQVDAYRAKRVEVRSEQDLPLQVEGEVCGHTPLTFEIIPSALQIRV
ncbi:MAG: diacylglycerol kinase family lipid kinase, partial [Anaerolineae bacterium]|nr:diacylglycerol kinase family lipid kinase [Anaerolineae bacterium]